MNTLIHKIKSKLFREEINDLKRKLYKQSLDAAKSIQQDGVTDSSEPRDEHIRKLATLERLISFCENNKPLGPMKILLRRKSIYILGFAVITLVLWSLFFTRVDQTPVRMEAKLNSVKFILSKEQELSTEPLELGKVAIYNVEIDLLKVEPLEPSDLDGCTTYLKKHFYNRRGFSIDTEKDLKVTENSPPILWNLNELTLPKKAEVKVNVAPQENYSVLFSKKHPDTNYLQNISLNFVFTGLSCSDRPVFVEFYPVKSGIDTVKVSFTLKRSSSLSKDFITPLFAIQEVLAFEFEFEEDVDTSIGNEMSSIIDGKILLYDIKTPDGAIKTHRISTGEWLFIELAEHKTGRIHYLKFPQLNNPNTHHEPHLLFDFYGVVQELHTSLDHKLDNNTLSGVSLMPTKFEWLQSRHSVQAMWAALLYVLGIFVVIIRWWSK